MFEIVNNIVRLTRGDTLKCTITIFDADGEVYTPTSGDVVRFALKKNIGDARTLIEKTLDNETLELEITATESKALTEGEYVYDVQLTKEDGTVDTFITPTRFYVESEVA